MALLKSPHKSKDSEAESSTKSASPPPPPYTTALPHGIDHENRLEPPDLAAGFRNLNLSDKSTRDIKPRIEECIAHLKLLESFYRLRQRIGSTDGIFGIKSGPIVQAGQSLGIGENEQARLFAKLAEKRWAVYVARAVDRFEKWYNAIMAEEMLNLDTLKLRGPSGQMLSASNSKPLAFSPHNLPPLDVLMVWHAYMLNPRAYLSDQLRYGKQRLWHTPFPWAAVDSVIDADTFAYNPSAEAENLFANLTGEVFINEDSTKPKSVDCPRCQAETTVPWTGVEIRWHLDNPRTTAELNTSIERYLTQGDGYCDKYCDQACRHCRYPITHYTLRTGKFRRDVKRLLERNIPMSGTILGVRGLPYKVHTSSQVDHSCETMCTFPNELLSQGLGAEILRSPLKDGEGDLEDMTGIRSKIEECMKRKSYMRRILKSYSSSTHRVHNIAIRKMMSNYWQNHSRFSLDLIGAVIRQGSFIEKMHNIDWLHSPALPHTMTRLITKYDRFLRLMIDDKHMAVPTLDVDLAWHTHQLDPSNYLDRTLKLTKQFIDHDDKVAETKLNDSFEWTSKTYQRTYGEPYSECTCWYCEAIRERHTSSASRLFSGGNARAAQQLHLHPIDRHDPAKSVHISAHNAVRPTDDKTYDFEASRRARALEWEYRRAVERAERKGKRPPRRDDYYYSLAYGYPVFIPAYSPYVGDLGCTPGYYPANPACMSVGAGSMGNCCKGTCGGAVAAGGCAAGAGCGSGVSGGASACGGASGGGCGGGGGGGGGCGGGGGGGGGCGGGS